MSRYLNTPSDHVRPADRMPAASALAARPHLGGDRSLAGPAQTKRAARFGHDFSSLRVHSEDRADATGEMDTSANTQGGTLAEGESSTGVGYFSEGPLPESDFLGLSGLSRLPAPRLQPKLAVNTPGDRHEQEADAVADQVMRMEAPPSLGAGMGSGALLPGAGSVAMRLVQRCACQDEEVQRCPCEDQADRSEENDLPSSGDGSLAMRLVQRCACEEEDEVRRKETGGPAAGATDVSASVSRGTAGGGQSLDRGTRDFMESRFGHDFGGVRVHTDSGAHASAQALSARAYTLGNDVVFRSGEYAPDSDSGRRLLAHELAHVVQQGGTSPLPEAVQMKSVRAGQTSEPIIQRWSLFGDDDDKKEDDKKESGGGLLDWAKEKGGAVVNSVSSAGGDAVDWAKEKGGGAVDWAKEKGGDVVDTVTQGGSDAVDWAKEKGGNAVDWAKEKGGDAVDWAKEKGGDAVDWAKEKGGDAVDWAKEKGGAVVDAVTHEGSSVLLEAKKSLALSQIGSALQKLGGRDTVSLTDDQIAAINGHIADLRGKSNGLINPPDLSAQGDSADAEGSDKKPVAASSLQALLMDLQSSVSAPFMSPAPDLNTTDSGDSGNTQGAVQRFAAVLPLVGGAGISIAGALAIVAIILIIVLLIVAVVMVVSNMTKEEEEKQKAEKEAKEKAEQEAKKEAERLKKVAECEAIHAAYDALKKICKSCTPSDTTIERAAKVACLTAHIAGRAQYLSEKCDYFLEGSIKRGSDVAEKGHIIQHAEQVRRLAKCSAMPTRK